MKEPVCIDREIVKILKVGDIVAATGGKVTGSGPSSFSGVCIDSRKIKAGELFIALKGDRFDGHNYIRQALDKGGGAVVSLPVPELVNGKTIISVKDTLSALQDIARFLRSKRGIPVVAVTGSNGKTTTKELISSILSSRYRVLKNAGNLNNHIGLPLSLANISEDDEAAVLEMGASGPGEIEQLCRIAMPDYGVLTNVSPTHLEGFKDIETVRKTKLELLDAAGLTAVNADDLYLMDGIHQSGIRGAIIRYGIQNQSDVYATDIELHDRGSSFILHLPEDRSIRVTPRISGVFNIYNVLAAASVGHMFNIGLPDIKSAIDSFDGVPMRLEIRDLNGIRIISDVYNANPASTEQALRELVRIGKARTVAVLGDMLELGTYEAEAHRKLGRLMSGIKIDVFIAVGARMAMAASEFGGETHKAQTAAEAGRLLRDILREGDTVLVKGSRGMGMEKVLEGYAL